MRILITGASGIIGRALCHGLSGRHELLGTSRSSGNSASAVPLVPWSLEDEIGLVQRAREFRPNLLVHLAAVSSPDRCEADPEAARTANVGGTARAVAAAAEVGAHLAFTSTDLVFDGGRGRYREEDPPSPISLYGRTKAEAEALVLAAGGCVLRVAVVYGDGRGRRDSFSQMILNRVSRGERPRLFTDQFRSHLYLEDIPPVVEAVGERRVAGILHLGGSDRLSRHEFGQAMAGIYGFDPDRLEPVESGIAGFQATRPADCSLDVSGLRERLGLRTRTAREGLTDQRRREEESP